MKKILIGTSALVAAGLLAAAPAQAQERISLSVGGFAKHYVGYASQKNDFVKAQNDAGTYYNEWSMVQDSEIHFSGSTTLDNGLTVAMLMQLEGPFRQNVEGSSRVWDHTWVSLAGGFGRVQIGNTFGAPRQLRTTAPGVGLGLEASDSVGKWVIEPGSFSARAAVRPDVDGTSGKINYFTPTFAGVTVGAFWAPDGQKVGSSTTMQQRSTNTQHYGIAARYRGEFEGVGIQTSVGWQTTDRRVGGGTFARDNLTETHAGLSLSYAGLTFGGGWKYMNDPRYSGTGNHNNSASVTGNTWNLGVQYNTGPYGVSLGYHQSKAAATMANNNDDTLKLWELSGEYRLGPGVTWEGTFAHVDFDSESDEATRNNNGWAVVTGLNLSF